MTGIGEGVDFGLLGAPRDYVGDYTNAFQVGRKLAAQQIEGNALQAYGANPNAPLNPQLMAANPELAVQIQNRQQAAANQQSTVQQAQAEAGGGGGAGGHSGQYGGGLEEPAL